MDWDWKEWRFRRSLWMEIKNGPSSFHTASSAVATGSYFFAVAVRIDGSQIGEVRLNVALGLEMRHAFLVELANQHQSFACFSRKALPITDTELRLMAAAAIVGLKRVPKAA